MEFKCSHTLRTLIGFLEEMKLIQLSPLCLLATPQEALPEPVRARRGCGAERSCCGHVAEQRRNHRAFT